MSFWNTRKKLFKMLAMESQQFEQTTSDGDDQ